MVKRTQKRFRLTAPKPYVPKEYIEQTDVFLWAHGRPARNRGKGGWTYAIPPQCKLPGIDMLYATLNGVRLPPGLAVKMKDAGLRAGPLDLNLDVARGGYHGLRIELKRTTGGRLSNAQQLWIQRLCEEGYLALVADGAKEAKRIIVDYLTMKR